MTITTKLLRLLELEGTLTGRLILLQLVGWLLVGCWGELDGFLGLSLLPQLHLGFSPEWSTLLRAPWTLLSYIFPHEHPLHLLANLLLLYWVGLEAERQLGAARTLALYIYGALAGSLSYLLGYQLSLLTGIGLILPLSLVGASAAILMVATVSLLTAWPSYSAARRATLGLVSVLVVGYIAAGLISDFNRGGALAHLGAILAGLLYWSAQRRGYQPSRALEGYLQRHQLLGCPPSAAQTEQLASTASPLSEAEQSELLGLQQRLRYSGYPSLTPQEQQRLLHLLSRSTDQSLTQGDAQA